MQDLEREIRRDKKIAKKMKFAAILVGYGVGLLVVKPFLPEIDDVAKMDAMQGLFTTLSAGLILYGLAIVVTFIVNKNMVLMINGVLAWFVLPTLGFWFVAEAFKVLTS